MKTYLEMVQDIKKELAAYYPPGEINSFIALILHHMQGMSMAQMHLKQDQKPDTSFLRKMEDILKGLKNHVPIQYLLGKTEFCDLTFHVAPGVLIPRPETEELVAWAVQLCKDEKNIEIMDMGTGSGCLAIALDKSLHCKRCVAVDISKNALEIARKNNRTNRSKVVFRQWDVLKNSHRKLKNKFDLIVSNPPYVTEKEKALMQVNVLDHEPHEALFVEDNDPLLFYRALGKFAINNLKPKGKLMVEINEAYGIEVVNLFLGLGFSDLVLKTDIHGKDRMVMCAK
jgi:release factor glutamine methyltransferase